MTIPKDWSYEEFSTFAMLYAASIDAQITPEEEALIQQRITPKQYAAIKALFEQCSDAECINAILDYHKHYLKNENRRQQLLGDFRQVFDADQRYSPMEQKMMHIFKKLL